jgi:acetyl-CoA C-acetyltransferase
MAPQLAAVLGTGQTKYVAKRQDVSMNGLVREAIDKALDDSGLTMADINAVVVGKAPDFFEGVMMPELFMADAVGATGKPLIRVHTAGSVGGSTGVVAASLVKSGKYRRVLAMAWEKQSESNAMWALSIPVPFTKPVGAGAGGYFAPHVRAYIRRSGAPKYIGAMVAVKDRLNGAKNPLAHLHQPDITLDKVMASQMLWDPIRFDETCPSSDGACAVVIGNEDVADKRVAEGHPVAWIHAPALRTEPLAYSGRDQVNPPKRCGKPRASPARSTRSTALRCMCRSRGSSRCGWRTSDLRPRVKGGSSPKRAKPRSAAASRSTCPAGCCRRTRSAPRVLSGSPKPLSR